MSRIAADLLDRDSARRWNIIVKSMVGTFACAVFLQCFGASAAHIQTSIAFVGISAYFSQVYLYLNEGGQERDALYAKKTRLRPFVYAAALGCFIVVLIIPSTKVQAGILNFRLRRVLEATPNKDRLSETKHILSYAKGGNIKLHSDLVTKASSTYGLEVDDLVGANGQQVDFSVLLREANEQVGDKHVVFVNARDVDFARQGVRDFDGESSDDTAYGNFAIYYAGGPLHLRNATFINTHFVVTDNPTVRAFIRKVVASGGVHVSFNSGQP